MAETLTDLTVHCDEAAPAVVRAAISQLAGIDRPVLEDTKLVASELVSNAVRHSRCTDQEFLNVRVSGDGRLRVSVVDPGRSGGIATIASRPLQLGGMGLKVVEQVASRWGAKRRAQGYEVWADVEFST
jgi:anti-sigma regulatory factor (Ser/Thr protein kinase)